MSRGSQIAIGLVLFLLALALLMLAMIPGEGKSLAVRLAGAAISAVIGFACVFSWGRPYTTRIAMGVLSMSMIAMIISIVLSDKPDIKPAAFAALIAVMSGAYAATGFYPESLPMSNVFGADSGRKRKKRKRPQELD